MIIYAIMSGLLDASWRVGSAFARHCRASSLEARSCATASRRRWSSSMAQSIALSCDAGCASALSHAVAMGPHLARGRDAGCASALSHAVALGPRSHEERVTCEWRGNVACSGVVRCMVSGS